MLSGCLFASVVSNTVHWLGRVHSRQRLSFPVLHVSQTQSNRTYSDAKFQCDFNAKQSELRCYKPEHWHTWVHCTVWDPCAPHNVVTVLCGHRINLALEPNSPPGGPTLDPQQDGRRGGREFMPRPVGCDNIYGMCTHPADLIWLQKPCVL